MKRLLLPALLIFISGAAFADDAKPLKALLVTGGCCHDYAKQKDILTAGIEKRANVKIDVIYSDDKSTHPPIAIYGNPDYAKGYDVVIHDECSADFGDLGDVVDQHAKESQTQLAEARQKLDSAVNALVQLTGQKPSGPGGAGVIDHISDDSVAKIGPDAVKALSDARTARDQAATLTTSRNEVTVNDVLAPHRAGIPGVNLHCAMHCYRIGNPSEKAIPGTPHAYWFEYLGLQSSGHGSQLPIAISFTDQDSPITKGMSDWTTIGEELYNNVQILTAHALAHGKQTVKAKQKQADGTEIEVPKENDYVVAWTNLYQGKTRVFSTTIGHNNQTVADDRYLDLVTHGLLWACDKLDANGQPKAGYGAGGK
jgi:Trehalose utilisation